MPRTDNDTWDLATSVGATATMVAAARAVATKADNPIINDQYAEPLVKAVGVDFLTRWASGDLNAAEVDSEDSSWKLQQMPDAMAARTRFFDAFFQDATQAGIRQAVILASGLDARAYRLEWPADMTVFEVDQPEVIAFKTETLSELGASPTTDRRTVAIDLRNDWPAALAEAGFDRSQPTAWIAEGLLGYLPPEAQDRLLDNIAALSADGSRLATEAIPDMPEVDQDKARELMQQATEQWRAHGFDLNFEELGYQGDRDDVAEYMDGLGWRSIGRPMSQLLAEHGLPPVPSGQRLGVDGRHDLLHLYQVTQAPQRRGFNDIVTRFWGVAAPAYNLPFLQEWVYRPAHDEVVAQLRDHQSARVADIACGTGILADRIQHDLHPAEVYGVDMSEGMLKQAQFRSSNIDWRRGPAEELPFDDEALDAVVTTSAFHFFDQPAALREFHRVLAPGGLAAVSTMSARQQFLPGSRLAPTHSPTPAEMRRLFEEAGFTIVEQHRVRRPLWTRPIADLFTAGVKS